MKTGSEPQQCREPHDWASLQDLISRAFAGMEGRIDPPSSMRRPRPESIAEQARRNEVWAIGAPPVACVFRSAKPDALFLGKLAVAAEHRALALGLLALELERGSS